MMVSLKFNLSYFIKKYLMLWISILIRNLKLFLNKNQNHLKESIIWEYLKRISLILKKLNQKLLFKLIFKHPYKPLFLIKIHRMSLILILRKLSLNLGFQKKNNPMYRELLQNSLNHILLKIYPLRFSEKLKITILLSKKLIFWM